MYDEYEQKPIFYIHVTLVQRPVKLYKTSRLSVCLYLSSRKTQMRILLRLR